eukprot:TRINITY_DN10419_c0_g1_i1.p1 TRINITY_DN10419_c0_g1~~TRINITY_DN10419_c0_g1_i1.p1  ORF type:complete len:692 (+),score=145.83 TRINITY_DN10419_c0_g1_i1:77-2077(+)
MHARNFFIIATGAVYLMAMVSYWVQFPGVGGADGVEPVGVFWKRVQERSSFEATPNLLWGAEHLNIEVDDYYEWCLLVGIASAFLICGFGATSPVLLMICFAVYHMVVTTGQSLLSFQWDYLILETGFAAIFYPSSRSQFTWILRITAFKIFFMSGALKVLSGCPTWTSLTALKYHYASQCIPTPLAWYAALLPEWFEKLSLAFVMWSQLFGSFMLISPFLMVRRVGAAFQIFSMIGIQATGNYNWFNIHSGCLAAMACFYDEDEDEDDCCEEADVADYKRRAVLVLIPGLVFFTSTVHEVAAVFLALLGLVLERSFPFVQLAGTVAFIVITYTSAYGSPLQTPVNSVTTATLQVWVKKVMPIVVPYLLTTVVVRGVWSVIKTVTCTSKHMVLVLLDSLHTAAMTCIALAIAVTSLTAMREVYKNVDRAVPKWPGRAQVMAYKDVYNQKLHVASGYGLFRVMTGVGDNGEVAVPVLVFEYNTEVDPMKWKEIQFRYAVGDVNKSPPWVAPHQPRVDWRLWFAALGNTRTDSWVVHMVVKLLRGSRPVLDVTGVDFKGDRPLSIKATLYHYNFTKDYNATAWWTSKPVRQWLPPITVSKDVKNFLSQRGWSAKLAKKPANSCRGPHTSWICTTVATARASAAGLGVLHLYALLLLAIATTRRLMVRL